MTAIHDCESVADIIRTVIARNRSLSVRQLSRKLGYASDRTVGMVAQGQREMGPEMLRRFSEFAKLNSKERDYLTLLSERQRKRRLGKPVQDIETKLLSHKNVHAKTRTLSGSALAGFEHWYGFTVIEILGSHKKAMTATQIRARLRGQVDAAELSTCLSALVELNLIKSVGADKFRALAEKEYAETNPDIPSKTVRNFHRAQLRRAVQTLEEQSVLDREFIAKTLTIAASRLPEFKTKMRAALEDLAGQFIVDQVTDPIVVQLNAQFYQQSLNR